MPPRNESANGGSSLSRMQGSAMAVSVIPTDTVQDVADSLGLPNLRESVASVLAADVEYRLRQVVQDASKFMRHGKRTQLRVADVDRALRQRNIEPIFGFHPTTLGKGSIAGAYATPAGSTFKRIQTSTGPIHLVADEEIDLEKILDTRHKVTLSPGVGWSAHWLAIEGVQPAVPQNPNLAVQTTPAATAAAAAKGTIGTAASVASVVQPGGVSAFLTPATAATSATKPGQPVGKPLIKHVLSRELQLYFERLTTSILTPPQDADVDVDVLQAEKTAANGQQQDKPDSSAADGDTSMASPKDVTSTTGTPAPTVNRSKPVSSGNTVRDAALASLRGDAGLHQLVPYLIQWINEKIQSNIRDEALLDIMLHTIDALISNPYLGIEPYLHQLLPYLLSILLIAVPSQEVVSEKSYILRTQAASIIKRIIQQHGATYTTLRPRIVRTLIVALDAGSERAERLAVRGEQHAGNDVEDQQDEDGTQQGRPRESAATKLGAVIALRALGPGCLRALLVNDQEHANASPTCILRRLGFWCSQQLQQQQVNTTNNTKSIDVIVDEIVTAFADVTTTLRGNVAVHQAVQAFQQNADVQQRLTTFWIDRFMHNVEACRGVLALLTEIVQQQQTATAKGTIK